MWGPRAALAATATALVLLTRLAAGADQAESTAELVAISYSARDTCPSEEEFFGIVRRYTTKWTPVAPRDGIRSFQIRIASRQPALAGTLELKMPNGKTTTRAIVGRDCTTVARALAVALATAIDPEARLSEPESKPVAPPTAPPNPAESGEELSPTFPVVEPVAERVPAAPASPEPTPWSFGIEARAEMTSTVTASALPVFGAAFEARLRIGSGVPAWLWPSLAVGVRQSTFQTIDAPIGSFAFLWTAATFRVCPLHFAPGPLEIAPCVEADAGVLQAGARGVRNARTSTTPWFDRGASLRIAYHLNKHWGLGATAFVTAPSSRRRFALNAGEVVSQAPDVGLTGGLFVEFRP